MSMRIVGGKSKGKRLFAPNGPGIRPTSDKVRGAVMNILRSRGVLDMAIVLDVFCGTGAMGLEALSQGAHKCIFIDNSNDSLNICRMNIDTLEMKPQTVVLHKDAKRLDEPEEEAATIAFLDPPYKDHNLLPAALESLGQGWIKNGTIVVAEVDKSFDSPLPHAYKIEDQRVHGDTKIMILHYTKIPV